jgi:hypothetical protein
MIVAIGSYFVKVLLVVEYFIWGPDHDKSQEECWLDLFKVIGIPHTVNFRTRFFNLSYLCPFGEAA